MYHINIIFFNDHKPGKLHPCMLSSFTQMFCFSNVESVVRAAVVVPAVAVRGSHSAVNAASSSQNHSTVAGHQTLTPVLMRFVLRGGLVLFHYVMATRRRLVCRYAMAL